ncbi:MAG: NADH-quinone oxidoreductase subunit L [Caldilineaceae bacterium]|nr:NADH-quinone oxidoreductase subunit L [Caldilineaceae bacterium]
MVEQLFQFSWLLLALPAAGLLINLLFGHLLSRKMIGGIASGVVAAAFLAGLGLFAALTSLPEEERMVTVQLWDWITIGAFHVNAALSINPLTILMVLVVTGVGALIHVYSMSYMEDDERYQRFFIYLNFFIFAMLLLVLSDNFLGLFVGWEGVGLASFLLIGFWFDRRDDLYGWYADAGKKAFLVNRVGDFGVILAIIMIWANLGTLNFIEVADKVHHGGLAVGTATIICLLLFLGVAGKSAQIPLFVWLPDAMAGPTPVSALIHAATMVTAGVFLMVRTGALWHVAVPAAVVAAWVGGLTAFFAATVALVQTDLKKTLAYSTISQLGYMVMAAGVGAYGGAMFHLTTHAFFKALLFLGAGSVMHATHGVLDMRRLGGLKEKMPATHKTFVIGAAALAGLPLMSGFFSKDAILLGALVKDPFLYVLGLITALMTAFYSFRMVFLTFYGEPKDQELYDHVHESAPLMTIPLWILAGFALVGGIINLPFVLTLDRWLEPVIGLHEEPLLTLELFAIIMSVVISLFGFYMAYTRYIRKDPWVERFAANFSGLTPWLQNAYYVDDFYKRAIVQPLLRLSEQFAKFDRKGIDRIVNDVGAYSLAAGDWLRRFQTGVIPGYAMGIFIGVVAVLVYFVFIG